MKDSIRNAGSEVSIVIYDSPLPPKYFRFSKKFIKTFLVIVPSLLGLLLIALFVWGLGSRIKETPSPSLPALINDDHSKVTELEHEVQSITASNILLQEKLSATPAQSATGEEPFLMAIKKPYGMQNLVSENRVTLDQFNFEPNASKVSFKFQIISSTPETRVTGHVLVFMISDSGLMGYPKDTNSVLSSGVKFSMGEPFAVSRLRPTNAEFSLRPTGENVKFVIYIFNREGDLLLMKESENYKLGSK